MRKVFGVIVASVLFGFAFLGLAKSVVRGEVLSPAQVKKKWGSDELNLKKFKVSGPEGRGKMAYALLTDKSFIGKSVLEVRDLLGDPDGFHVNDAFPSYIIELGENQQEETWQIVFRLDRRYRVEEVFINKNCCD